MHEKMRRTREELVRSLRACDAATVADRVFRDISRPSSKPQSGEKSDAQDQRPTKRCSSGV